MQRAAVSIPANIAEGAGRNTDNEFIRFLEYSVGSAYELGTELLIAYNQKYIENVKYNEMQFTLIEIQKMLYSLIQKNTKSIM